MNNVSDITGGRLGPIHPNPISWHQAIEILVARGWRRNEIHCCLDILNGHDSACLHLAHRGMPPWGGIAFEMFEGERLNRTATSKWNISDEVWSSRIDEVHAVEQVQQAVSAIAFQFWAECQDEVQPCATALTAVTS